MEIINRKEIWSIWT